MRRLMNRSFVCEGNCLIHSDHGVCIQTDVCDDDDDGDVDVRVRARVMMMRKMKVLKIK